MEPRKKRKPKNEVFEGDVREDFMKLTWEEQSGEIFSITYMSWGRETRSKYSKRVKIWSEVSLGLSSDLSNFIFGGSTAWAEPF